MDIVNTYDAPARFQSTHPARGATCFLWVMKEHRAISIHAPREGCDLLPIRYNFHNFYFNPRTPRGVRPLVSGVCNILH